MSGLRVAGCDPGTSSLDALVLEEGQVLAQTRFSPAQVREDPFAIVRWLHSNGPHVLVAAPSGYGLPLIRVEEVTPEQLRLLSLVRADEANASGVAGFSGLIDAFCHSLLPAVFLPGVVHLPEVPSWRKVNRIDLGTADKVCVAALAIAQASTPPEETSLLLVELGSAFTACVVVHQGQIVDGLGGTVGSLGWGSGGGWDGELAYLLGPLQKADLFRGGCSELPSELTAVALTESVLRAVAGLLAVTDVPRIVLSGRLLDAQPEIAAQVECSLHRLRPVQRLEPLSGAWVKAAAQGAAIIANGLAGGRWASLVNRLGIRQAKGTALDGVAPQWKARLRLA